MRELKGVIANIDLNMCLSERFDRELIIHESIVRWQDFYVVLDFDFATAQFEILNITKDREKIIEGFEKAKRKINERFSVAAKTYKKEIEQFEKEFDEKINKTIEIIKNSNKTIIKKENPTKIDLEKNTITLEIPLFNVDWGIKDMHEGGKFFQLKESSFMLPISQEEFDKLFGFIIKNQKNSIYKSGGLFMVYENSKGKLINLAGFNYIDIIETSHEHAEVILKSGALNYDIETFSGNGAIERAQSFKGFLVDTLCNSKKKYFSYSDYIDFGRKPQTPEDGKPRSTRRNLISR